MVSIPFVSDGIDAVGGVMTDATGMAVGATTEIFESGMQILTDDIPEAAVETTTTITSSPTGAADLATDLAAKVAAQAAEDVVDGVTHVATTTWDTGVESVTVGFDAVKWLGAAGGDMVGTGSMLVGDAVRLSGVAANTAMGGYGDDLLEAADATAFDAIDEATAGLVDVDWSDGGFSAGVGVGGYGVSQSIGEHGISADGDVGLASGAVGVGGSGLLAEGAGGVDGFPLPYASGHVDVDADGNVVSNGHYQGPVPVPADGMVYADDVNAGYTQTDDTWSASADAHGTYYRPDGTAISGGAGAGYAETPDGNTFAVDASGSVRTAGGVEYGGGVEYVRVEQDGDVSHHAGVEGHASGYGVSASGRAGYDHVETEDGTSGGFSADAGARGYGQSVRASSDDGVSHSSEGFDVDDVIGAAAAHAGPVGAEAVPGESSLWSGGEPEATYLLQPEYGDIVSEGGYLTGGDLDPPPLDQAVVEDLVAAVGTKPEPDDDDLGRTLREADEVEDSVDDLFDGLE